MFCMINVFKVCCVGGSVCNSYSLVLVSSKLLNFPGFNVSKIKVIQAWILITALDVLLCPLGTNQCLKFLGGNRFKMFLMLLLNEWTGLSLLCMSALTSLNFPPSNCCGPLGLLLPAKLVFFCLYLRRYFGAHTNYQPLTMIFTWSSSHTQIRREHVFDIQQSEGIALGPFIDIQYGCFSVENMERNLSPTAFNWHF